MTIRFSSRVLLGGLALLLTIALPHAAEAQGAIKIIVHPTNPLAELTAADASSLFLRKVKKFPAGDAASPVDQAKGSPARAEFAKSVHGKSASAIDTWWQQQIFGGGETPPPTKGSDAEVVAWVKATPGAIGYVSAAADVSGVKVVALK